jgi:hypothetical protein
MRIAVPTTEPMFKGQDMTASFYQLITLANFLYCCVGVALIEGRANVNTKRTWKSAGEVKTAWVCDYVDQGGKRRLKTFRLEKQAKAWATTTNHEIAQGIHAPDAKTTVESIVDLWINHSINEGLERSTIEQRRRHARLHIGPFVGRMKAVDLTEPRIHAFLDKLRDAGMSTAMRRKVLTSLSSALTFAKSRGMIAQDVARGLKITSNERHKASGPLKAGRDFPTKAELKS